MKTRLLAGTVIAALLMPAMASAQTAELRRDRQEVRQEQRELRQAERHGSARDVREERRDVRDARRELREDRRDYRQDQRRDWREHRRTHRADYRMGRFNAPFRYRTFNDGTRITPSYYAPAYRIGNVNRWRLPPAGRAQLYVRHYNDLLLVNTRSGIVIRAYRGFFW